RKGLLPDLEEFCRLPPQIGVLPTSGAAEAIALVMHELSSSGMNGPLAIPEPAYGAFGGLAHLLRLPTETYQYSPSRNWAPDGDELVDLAKRCAAIVVNNPHNPSGHVISDELLHTLARETGKRGALLIVDEVFRTEDETVAAIELGDHVITIGS